MGHRRLKIALALIAALAAVGYFVGRPLITNLRLFRSDLAKAAHFVATAAKEILKIDPFTTRFQGSHLYGTTLSKRFFAFDLLTQDVLFQQPVFQVMESFEIRGDVAYFTDEERCLKAVDVRNGSVLWTLKANVDAFEPIVAGDDLVVFWQDEDILSAADAKTGALIWHLKSPGMYYGDPITVGAGVVSYKGRDGQMHAVDLAKGQELWARKFTTVGELTVRAGSLYLHDINVLYCLDLRTGRSRWEFALPLGNFSTIKSYRNTLYGLTNEGHIYALDARTGREFWSHEPESKIYYHSGLAWDFKDNRIYILEIGPGALLSALDASDGSVLWSIAPEEQGQRYAGSALRLDEETLYATLGQTICAVNAATGTFRWSRVSPEVISTDHLHVLKDRLYFETRIKESGIFRVHALNKATGVTLSTADFRYDNSIGSLSR